MTHLKTKITCHHFQKTKLKQEEIKTQQNDKINLKLFRVKYFKKYKIRGGINLKGLKIMKR